MPELKMLAQALRDPEYWKSVGSGATNALNRGLVGGFLGAPVDVTNMAMGSLGLPVSNKPVMGSEWIGQKMQDAGIVSGDRNAVAEGLAAFIDPATAGPAAMKAAAYASPLAAAFGSTAIGSKASEGAKLSKLASALRNERGVIASPASEFARYEMPKLERGRFSWQFIDDTGKVIKEYPASFSRKDVQTKYMTDIADDAERAAQKKLAAKEAKIKNAKIKEEATNLNNFFSANKDKIESFHKQPELEFMPVNDEVFNQKQAKFIYQSPSYGGKLGSAYKLVMIDGRPAYARQSDHWGRFSSRSSADSEKWNDYNWNLPGSERGKRQTGVVFLDDL